MSITDIIKHSFLESYGYVEMGTGEVLVALGFALAISLYIFICYRLVTRNTFYSRNFNLSLIALALITTAIILTIQVSFVVSLGMVGALSIVRFRTAIKDPMDLVFLFWSISVGIICGAGLSEIAIIVSLLLSVVIFLVNAIVPMVHAPMILTVNYEANEELDEQVMNAVKNNTRSAHVKARSIRSGRVSLVVEVRTASDVELSRAVAAIEGVTDVTVMSHNGEVTY
ncbi:MAG: DUF4956 domain-containing protein [Lachnospiraceae bacterium]|nr:DUF4956 domain-containing protein [Lachnospiraceae bacterium]